MNTVILENWMPAWNSDEDHVSIYDKMNLRIALARFVVSPVKTKSFTSEIPFRIWGEIYGDERVDDKGEKVFEDGCGVLTSYIKEVRRVDTEDGTDAFDVCTENSVYRVSANGVNYHWIG